MNVYIKHRFLLLLPVLLGITFFTFVLMQLPADDTVDMMYKASERYRKRSKQRPVPSWDSTVRCWYVIWTGCWLSAAAIWDVRIFQARL